MAACWMLGSFIFYGLTAVKFCPYVLASWVGMIPGTLGRAGVEAAAGAGSERGPMEWALLTVGLPATLLVTIWISRIARRALKDAGEIPAESARLVDESSAPTGGG